MSLSIAPEPMDSPDARRLIAALDVGLAALYPPEQRFGPNLKAHQLEDGGGVFLIARDGERAIGCGAIRVLDGSTAEVKRMFVDDAHRGKGIGRSLLITLEAAARAMGIRRLVLETGIHQDAAIALYLSAGFSPVDCWGEYADAPTSVCFKRELSEEI